MLIKTLIAKKLKTRIIIKKNCYNGSKKAEKRIERMTNNYKE